MGLLVSEIPIIRPRLLRSLQDCESLFREIDVAILHLYRSCTSESDVMEWIRQLLLDTRWEQEASEMLRYSYGSDRLQYLKRIVAEDF